MALIYLAHPIDKAGGNPMVLAMNIQDELRQHEGISVFTPADAWSVKPPHDARVQRINERALHMCDVLLVYLPSNVWTRGVPVEITIANERHIPVVLVSDIDKSSLIETYWANHHNVHVYETERYDLACEWAAALARAAVKKPDDKRVARFTGGATQLTQAFDGDAGFDLAYNGNEPLVIGPHTMARIPTGVCVEMPRGVYAVLTGRSSTFSKRNLITPMSVIDEGFRGELFAVVWNFGDQPQTIAPGERVIQLLPMDNVARRVEWQPAAELSPTERADLGFGSSGR
jgi:dUTP pyrophosphatase